MDAPKGMRKTKREIAGKASRSRSDEKAKLNDNIAILIIIWRIAEP
jgi:hypothetical protein